MGLRWIKIALALGLISLVALWGAQRAYTQRQCQTLLVRARDEMSQKRWGVARTTLMVSLMRTCSGRR